TLLNLISEARKVLTVGRLEGKVYPFPGIYSKVILPELSRCLAVNELRIQSFIAQQDHHLLSLEEFSSSPKEEFANFNSPGDSMLWEKLETEVKPI
ncbi:MAG: hypothetical protein LPK25_12515, partial [Cyclobacteriaceae bacterium]|nr:hypothetical protein [Cyclobacteriaceae bacterium]MDX5467353.1 hypothetical protein [Cyclobacteriaceae bacterium]